MPAPRPGRAPRPARGPASAALARAALALPRRFGFARGFAASPALSRLCAPGLALAGACGPRAAGAPAAICGGRRRAGRCRAGSAACSWASIADRRASTPRRAAIAPSRRSTPSSMPSSRCETERSRRVSRSMSAAEGMLSAPIATSCAWAAFSRASNARPIAPVSSGFSSRSESAFPSRSSVLPPRRSRRFLATLLGSDMLCSCCRLGGRAAAAGPAGLGRHLDEGYGAPVPRAAVRLHPVGVPVGPRPGRRPLPAAHAEDREPERVVVIGTLGAARAGRRAARGRARGRERRARRARRGRERAPEPEPEPVSTTRAT